MATWKAIRYSVNSKNTDTEPLPSGATSTQAGLAKAMNLFLESLTGICFAVAPNSRQSENYLEIFPKLFSLSS